MCATGCIGAQDRAWRGGRRHGRVQGAEGREFGAELGHEERSDVWQVVEGLREELKRLERGDQAEVHRTNSSELRSDPSVWTGAGSFF